MTLASIGLLILMFQPAPPPPKLTVALHAARESVAPGGQTELAVEITISAPWHLYHPVPLDTGLPTSVDFELPAGVEIGPLRFPAPVLGEAHGLEYLELSGTFVALGELRIAPDVKPGQALRIAAKVSGLACVEECIPVEATAALSVPVSAQPGAAAQAELFQKARPALAKPLEDAPYLKGSRVKLAADPLRIGQESELIATLRVAERHHVQDRDPGVEGLIPTRVWVAGPSGLEIAAEEQQVWPKPHEREMPHFGKVREQSGEFQVRVPLKIAAEDFPAGTTLLRVLVQYQACSDEGACFPPEFAEAFVRFTADTPNAPGRPGVASAAGGPPTGKTPGGGTATTGGTSSAEAVGAAAPRRGLWQVLILAFLGGLILNVMPCVLPVISIKIVSFVQQGAEDPGRVLRLGLAFCAGILVWFWLFALLTRAGRLTLQEPAAVIAIGSIVFVLALNLFGVFEFTLPSAAAGKLAAAAGREGYSGAFMKGLLATLLGTACTAPFLATALVYGATQTLAVALLVFSMAGVGMASPYLLLCANPSWLRYVPRPGPWLVSFKQAMGFLLVGTAVWLLWVVAGQLGADGAVWTVAFWSFLGLAAWIYGRATPLWSTGAAWAARGAALAVVGAGYWFSFQYMLKPAGAAEETTDSQPRTVAERVTAASWDEGIPWTPYRKGLAEELASQGFTVYVDYTARWCATCLTNKATSLEVASTRARMKALRVIPIKADFTRRDPEMLAEIQRFGRSSVPLNVIYPANRPQAPIVLPIVLTPREVAAALEQAGASQADARVAHLP